MQIKKKINIIFSSIIFFLLLTKSYSLEKNYIEVKVNNTIITKSDIINEKNLLTAYNENLKTLKEDELYTLAKNSLIRQEIKRGEILKYYELNYTSSSLDKFVNEFYKKLNIENDLDIKKFLEIANITENEMREKIEIETLWNQLVFKKYQDKVTIDVELFKDRLKKEIVDLKPTKSFFLSEIFYNVLTKEEIDEKKGKILKSIEDIGFNNTANIFSISGSANFGGEIGWVKSSQLSTNIYKKISLLKVGEYTNEPITVPGGFLILKINDIKEEKVQVDFDEELQKIINYEKNKQLNQFSQIYYKKVEKDSVINEN
tara:strand:- start:1267 stop:2214 length:948 start_codon:yes stop_codon:yes gene_type:complete